MKYTFCKVAPQNTLLPMHMPVLAYIAVLLLP